MHLKPILVCATLVLGSPAAAWAQGAYSDVYPQGPYAGFAIGYNNVHNHSFPIGAGTGAIGSPAGKINAKSSDGFAATLTTGYDFGPVWFLGHVDAEAEFGYRYNSVDSLSLRAGTGNIALPNSTGDTQTVSLLVNFVNEFNPKSLFDPYIGGGAGFAWVGFNNYGSGLEARQRLLDDSDVVFAWQGIAGIRSNLTDAFALDVSYRYFRPHDPSYTNALGQSVKSSYTASTVMVGLTYNY